MPVSSEPTLTRPFVLYQSTRLTAYAERLNHGFTGKPITLGGAAFPDAEIQANRDLLCAQAGLERARLTVPRQTHSDQHRTNDRPCETEADAVLLTEPGIPAFVQVADCVPVILYAPDRHIGAVIHAGWRGTAKAITAKLAQLLIHEHNVSPEQLIAVIGPSIGGCCYEVSPEVATEVAKTIPIQPESAYLERQPNGKPRIDLKQVNRLQLEALGLQQVEIIDACTLCLDDHLWSHRRGEAGRQVAFLQLQALPPTL
jgi:YfiH family protein